MNNVQKKHFSDHVENIILSETELVEDGIFV